MWKIPVLFVMKDSIYNNLKECDCYDEARNALTYKGNYPVIAHPPCQLWGALAHVNYKRWGGEHNKPGNDNGLFKFALDTVKRCGGVLEHPANSGAWKAHGIVKPKGAGWQRLLDGGWVCEVWQSAYGHKANKATILYYYGNKAPASCLWQRKVGTHQVGQHDQRGKEKNKPTLSKREANKTPALFAEYLVGLVRDCFST